MESEAGLFTALIGLCIFICLLLVPVYLAKIHTASMKQLKLLEMQAQLLASIEVHMKISEAHLGQLTSFFGGRNVEIGRKEE